LIFDSTIDLDPSTTTLDQNPTVVAHRLAALGLVAKVEELVKAGNIEKAFKNLETARHYDPAVNIEANTWNEVCWWGSLYRYKDGDGLWQYRDNVLDACAQAVKAEVGNGNFLDSQGVALALAERDKEKRKEKAANYSEAIKDFRASTTW